MKLRRQKHRMRRMLHEAIRKSYVFEMGHHMRWWWTVRPDSFGDGDPHMVPDRFDPKFGRLSRWVP